MIDNAIRFGLNVWDLLRIGACSYREYFKLKRMQYASRQKLNEMSMIKLRHLVRHAYHRVPFYRRLYDEKHLDPRIIKRVEDLRYLPITAKAMFRRAFPHRCLAQGYESRAIHNKTSGSTGEPFEFFNDRFESPIMQASYMLFNTWIGVKTPSRFVHIRSPSKLSLKMVLRDKMVGRNRISTLDINSGTIKGFVKTINRIEPAYIEGYTASLVNASRLIKNSGLAINCRPKAIIATSEDLLEHHRALIESVFRCKVFNRYGSREFSGAVAQECGHCGGLHVNTSLCLLEVVDKDGEPVGEGEGGKVLITDLNNYTMPFIRYDIGDYAVKGPERSECGRTFPLINRVRGREGYYIISKTGEKIPFLTISSTLFQRFADQVSTYQFVQRRRGELLLEIIPTKKFNEEVIEDINKYLEETLHNFSLRVELVENIPPTSSGKTPFLITLNQ